MKRRVVDVLSFFVRRIAVFVFVAAALSAGARAEGGNLREAELHYGVFWLGVPMAEAVAKVRGEWGGTSESGGRETREGWQGRAGEVVVRGETRTAGPLAVFYDWQGFAETRGAWTTDGFVPASHRNGGKFRGKNRSARVRWSGAGSVPEFESDPPPDLAKVSPVLPETLPGARDPFSAALSAGRRIAESGRCGGVEKIWDGRRRADWSLSHAGFEILPADDSGAWSGEAAVCELRVKKIGGFRRDSKYSPKVPPRVWIAEALPGLWVPVRAEVKSRWGTVVAFLDVRKTGASPPSTTEVAGGGF